jgi:POT family proton-dependent oligopeptide transporter
VRTFRQLTADDFWENAKPSKQVGEAKPAWMTFDDNWVDEVKRGLKACTVFCWYPIYCKWPIHKLGFWSFKSTFSL